MTNLSAKSSQVTAAVCALALSLLTFTGTVATPAPAQASVTYVGVVA